jgi:DNA-binding NarL/FixJ family response regulator
LVLVDDHRLVRAGLQSILEAAGDITVVGTAADGDEALASVREHRPDVVLMDLSMPRVDGVSATRQIVAEFPGVQVVVLTSFADSARVQDALDAGALGYLLKDTEPEVLVSGIRSVVAGESPLDPRVTRAVVAGRAARQATGPATLTDREREVLRLVGRGLANKQIGRVLGISERTVKAHLTNAFARIGVSDRTSAALWVQRNLPADATD